jgi:hypothetical protein
MRCPSASASLIEWVMKIPVALVSRISCRNSLRKLLPVTSSSAENGSSHSRIAGSMEGAGDGHTLAHAAGERVGKIVLVTAQARRASQPAAIARRCSRATSLSSSP